MIADAYSPSFVFTLQGVVQKFATSGIAGDKDVQSVYLQDTKGDVLKVVFHDEWATGPHLKVANMLQIYFAKVLPGKGDRSKEVTLWVYYDAHVEVVEQDANLVEIEKEIKLGSP